MKKIPPAQSPPRGFTLVEVLVVIAIIAVLASVGFGVAGHALNKARMVEDQQAARILAMGIATYFEDYGRFPGAGDGVTDTRIESDAALMNVLMAHGPDGAAQNPRGHRYYSGRVAEGDRPASAHRGLFYSGGSSVELFDVWKKRSPAKRHYQVVMDTNLDGEIGDPINNGEAIYGVRALVWSTGRDGEDGGGGPQSAANRDNSYSWR
jgi:prepilin-type N-terminal cleavage/methylation domain-containing protein